MFLLLMWWFCLIRILKPWLLVQVTKSRFIWYAFVFWFGCHDILFYTFIIGKWLTINKEWIVVECSNMFSFAGRKLKPCAHSWRNFIWSWRNVLPGSSVTDIVFPDSCESDSLWSLCYPKAFVVPDVVVLNNFPRSPSDLSLLPLYACHTARHVWDGEVA